MLGSHIKKGDTYFKTFSECPLKVMQIFAGSTKSYFRRYPSEEDCELTKKYLKESGNEFYIHGTYLLNIAREGETIKKAIKCVSDDLKIGNSLGCKGVVIHVGKSLKMKMEDAEKHSKENIETLLKVATPECPLIIETPAGQGTEMYTKIDDFLDLIDNYKDNTALQICVDSCHVFASGYEPLDYLKKVIERFPQKRILVHYNDSKECLGSRKDRHEVPGEGHIGKEKMNELKKFCEEKEINMIIE